MRVLRSAISPVICDVVMSRSESRGLHYVTILTRHDLTVRQMNLDFHRNLSLPFIWPHSDAGTIVIFRDELGTFVTCMRCRSELLLQKDSGITHPE